MAPTTPARKAIMPPPPCPTPKTPSNALVVYRPCGPVVPTTSARTNTPKSEPGSQTGFVKVKPEPGLTPSPSVSHRGPSAFPTPPSTSLVRRSRTITPSPRKRSSSTPCRSRATSVLSPAAFRAKLAEARARTPRVVRRDSHAPAAGPGDGGLSSKRRSVTVEDDDEDEVEFWGGRKVKGLAVDVAIDLASGSDSEESPSSSPTPSTLRGTSVTRSLVRPDQIPSLGGATSLHNSTNNDRSQRGESTFSVASSGSRATPFMRAPTWDDSDQRYGRTYPRADGSTRDTNSNSAINTLPLVPPVPVAFNSSLVKACELISSLQGKHPKTSTEDEQDDGPRMSLEDRLVIVLACFFNDDMLQNDGVLWVRLKEELATSNIDISPCELANVVRFLRASVHQSLKSHIMDYRNSTLYKGTRDARQSMWFSDLKTYLKLTIPTFGSQINKDLMEDVVVNLNVVMHEKEIVQSIMGKLKDKFDDCTIAKIRKMVNSIIDLFATIVNIGFPK